MADRRVPKPYVDLLDASGVPWAAEVMANHIGIRVNGRLATVVSMNGRATWRQIRNGTATLKRAIKRARQGADNERSSQSQSHGAGRMGQSYTVPPRPDGRLDRG